MSNSNTTNYYIILFAILLFSLFFNVFLVYSGETSRSYIFQLPFIFIFLISFFRSSLNFSSFSIYFILLNIPAFIFSINSIGLDSTYLLVATVLVPALYYDSFKKDFSFKILDLIIAYFLIKSILYLVLIPFELEFADKINLAELQFSGGQYHNIAILILLVIFVDFAKAYGYKINKYLYLLIKIILFLTIIISFSRGALIVLLLLLFAEINFRSILLGIVIAFLSVFFLDSFILTNQFIEENFILNYWMVRFGLYDNYSGIQTNTTLFDISLGMLSRIELWSQVYNLDLFNYIFGNGIGTSSDMIKNITQSRFAFSSFHNFFITVFIERGILFLLFFSYHIFDKFMFCIKHIRTRKFRVILYIIAFLIYISTTGADLFLNSRDFNIDLLVLFMSFFVLINFVKNKTLNV